MIKNVQKALSLLVIFSFSTLAYGQKIVVNEVQSSNKNTVQDEDGDYEDWIELYNAESFAVDLEGWFISKS